MIEIKNIIKKYGDKIALDNISLELPNTGFIVLEGKNGSGKSTLINLIGTLDSPSSGTIIVDNYELTCKSENELCKYREENIGFIFQENNLFENMTVRENINIVGSNSNFEQIVTYLEIEDLVEKKAKKLSGGEQQKVAIARTILKHPKIVLADEPTSAIDTDTKGNILNLLKQISKHSLVIIVSHDIETVQRYADKIIRMERGKIINIENLSSSVSDNNVIPYKNKFNPRNFTFSNLFTNKKQMIRNCILLIISFLFIMIATAIFSLDFIEMQAETMRLENDNLIILRSTNPALQYIPEESINNINREMISNNIIFSGKGIYDINNRVISFEIKYSENLEKPNVYDLSFISSDALKKVEYGRKPEKANEIVITSYLADQMIKNGVLNKFGEYYYPKNYDDLVSNNVALQLENNFVTVSGIKNLYLNNYNSMIASQKIKNEGFDIYVLDSFFELYPNNNAVINPEYMFTNKKYIENNAITLYKYKTVFTDSVELLNDSIIENLNSKEVIMSEDALELANINKYDCVGKEITFYILKDYTDEPQSLTATIVGVSKDNKIYFSRNDVSKYLNARVNINKVVVYHNNKNLVKETLNYYLNEKKDLDFVAETNFSEIYKKLEAIGTTIIFIFFITAVALILVSIISMFNFISNTIDENKKEIALLKSLGVQNIKILYSYSLQIFIMFIESYICGLLSFLFIRLIINQTIFHIYQFKINFVPISVLTLILIISTTIIVGLSIIILIFFKIRKTSPQILLKDINI